MNFLIYLAFSDGGCSSSQEEILSTIAEALEFDLDAYHTLFVQFEQVKKNVSPILTLEYAYKILGISKDSDIKTVKKAYKKLVRLYHPDIISSLVKDEAYMKESTAKTQEINQAYKMIKVTFK